MNAETPYRRAERIALDPTNAGDVDKLRATADYLDAIDLRLGSTGTDVQEFLRDLALRIEVVSAMRGHRVTRPGNDLAAFLAARWDEDEASAYEVVWWHDDYPNNFSRDHAEVEAKRRILELHKSGDAWCDHCSGWSGPDPAAGCPTLKLLALPYSDHPEFDSSWRVDSARAS